MTGALQALLMITSASYCNVALRTIPLHTCCAQTMLGCMYTLLAHHCRCSNCALPGLAAIAYVHPHTGTDMHIVQNAEQYGLFLATEGNFTAAHVLSSQPVAGLCSCIHAEAAKHSLLCILLNAWVATKLLPQ